MRKSILIILAAATALTSPGYAFAKEHGKHGWHEGKHDRKWDGDRKHRRNHVAYVAPYRGWKYRPVYVGYELRPGFYHSRYFITDYGVYGIRAPGRYQRWIRYGDDLLLVNVRTGRVLRIIPGGFY
jgi:Ni/Co efflux regulator RcnB